MSTAISFSLEELQNLNHALREYRKYYEQILEIVRNEYRPSKLVRHSSWNDPTTLLIISKWTDLADRSAEAIRAAIQNIERRSIHRDSVSLNLAGYLKRAFLYWRKREVRNLEKLKSTAIDVEYQARIEDRIKNAEVFAPGHDFEKIAPEPIVRLTDFLTLQRVEAILSERGDIISKPPKLFDDKFGVLSPPSAVSAELHYWRDQCELRGVGLALVYMDIDNFKKEFNSNYNETIVDRECLPVIMQSIESHVFRHGEAFHEGGDEFLVLLPNVSVLDAIESMDRLRIRIPELKFHTVTSKAKFSIGICHVDPDSPLTDEEVRRKANEAKKYAKEIGEKNCVAIFGRTDNSGSSFAVVRPRPSEDA